MPLIGLGSEPSVVYLISWRPEPAPSFAASVTETELVYQLPAHEAPSQAIELTGAEPVGRDGEARARGKPGVVLGGDGVRLGRVSCASVEAVVVARTGLTAAPAGAECGEGVARDARVGIARGAADREAAGAARAVEHRLARRARVRESREDEGRHRGGRGVVDEGSGREGLDVAGVVGRLDVDRVAPVHRELRGCEAVVPGRACRWPPGRARCRSRTTSRRSSCPCRGGSRSRPSGCPSPGRPRRCRRSRPSRSPRSRRSASSCRRPTGSRSSSSGGSSPRRRHSRSSSR